MGTSKLRETPYETVHTYQKAGVTSKSYLRSDFLVLRSFFKWFDFPEYSSMSFT